MLILFQYNENRKPMQGKWSVQSNSTQSSIPVYSLAWWFPAVRPAELYGQEGFQPRADPGIEQHFQLFDTAVAGYHGGLAGLEASIENHPEQPAVEIAFGFMAAARADIFQNQQCGPRAAGEEIFFRRRSAGFGPERIAHRQAEPFPGPAQRRPLHRPRPGRRRRRIGLAHARRPEKIKSLLRTPLGQNRPQSPGQMHQPGLLIQRRQRALQGLALPVPLFLPGGAPLPAIGLRFGRRSVPSLIACPYYRRCRSRPPR